MDSLDTLVKPLSMDDVHKIIGALYLEIDMLRRQNAALRAHIEANSGKQ